MSGTNKKLLRKKAARRKPRRAKINARRPKTKLAKNAPSPAAVLNSVKLKELYSSMLKCRMLSDKLHALHASRQINSLDDAPLGREAVLVGAISHALAGDSIAAAHSAWLASYVRGTRLISIFARLAAGACTETAGFEHTNTHGSPAQRTMVVAMTLAHQMQGGASVVLAFCGEDTDADAFQYDALALAAKHKLPLVCLVEKDFSFEWTGEHQTTHGGAASATAESHFPEITVDGSDVVAMFRVAQEAVRRARAGHGPSLIHCVMPDKGSEARRSSLQHDPLALMEDYLRRRGEWSDERHKIAQDFGREMDEAITAAKSLAAADIQFDHVYSSPRHHARSSHEASTSQKLALPRC